jgi:hypothetical protein
MNRPLLSVCSVVLFEKQRDQLSGVDKFAVPTTQTSSAVLDAPVDTGDAPVLVQKP